MRKIARLSALVLLLTLLAPQRSVAGELAFDQLAVPNGRILSISPDGRWLLASHPVPSDAGSTAQVRVMLQDDADEDEPKLCVYAVPSLVPRSCTAPGVYESESGLKFINGSVSWSPDSQSIVMSDGSIQVNQDGDVWLLDALTGELTDLTDDAFAGDIPFDYDGTPPVYIDLQPTHSPDGQSIAFARTTFGDDDRPIPSVVRLDLVTGQISTIATLPTDPYHLISDRIGWSSDATRVYFATTGVDESTVALWSAAVDGSSLTRITSPFDQRGFELGLHQINSTVDQAIVWFSSALRRIKPPYYGLIDLNTGSITELSPSDSAVIIYSMAFGPDDNLIMAEEIPGDGDVEDTVRILSLDPATGEMTLLGGDLPGLEFNPLQSGLTVLPDDLIAYPNSRDGDDFAWTLVSLTGVDPIPATPISSGFAPGATVVTTDATVLRTTPAKGGAIAAALESGTELVVIDASVEIDGILWWPVRDPATGALGYVAAALIVPQS